MISASPCSSKHPLKLVHLDMESRGYSKWGSITRFTIASYFVFFQSSSTCGNLSINMEPKWPTNFPCYIFHPRALTHLVGPVTCLHAVSNLSSIHTHIYIYIYLYVQVSAHRRKCPFGPIAETVSSATICDQRLHNIGTGISSNIFQMFTCYFICVLLQLTSPKNSLRGCDSGRMTICIAPNLQGKWESFCTTDH